LDGRFGLSWLIKKAPLMGAFLLSAFYLAGARGQCPLPPSGPLAVVARVVDGDTLRLADGRRVRLIGINAPETASRGRPAEPYAVAARQRLQALVDSAGGQLAIVPGAQSPDRYGRTLANAYAPDGQNLEAQLLRDGLAYQVVMPPNDALRQCHAAAERSARLAGSGLWRGFTATPVAALKRAGFAVVAGQVIKVERNGGGLWLELEGGLVLHVPRRSEQAFDLAGLQALRGQSVEARGWVTSRARRSGDGADQARWVLRLTAPAMLQALPLGAKVVGAEP
jgi:endonuclease YncB( thermonuclease family)